MTQNAITLDDAEVSHALQALLAVTGHLEPALDDIGDYVANSIRMNFREQHDPDGEPWEPLARATLENRRREGKGAEILRDTGGLARSITHNANDYAVEIGSNSKYANMMHYGGKKADFPWLWGDIPARNFVGVSAADEEAILAIIQRHLQRASGAF